MMRPARIAAVEVLSPRFRLVDLEGEALKGVAWSVGQKLQISMGTGLTTRTYTPTWWDGERGKTRLLVFAHGEGPGSRWSEGMREGDACQFFGPRRSLDLAGPAAPLVLFGDETSFALAAALRATPGLDASYLFETTDVTQSRSVLEATGLIGASLIARAAGDAHLTAIAAEMSSRVARGAHFVLTGKAQSIQHLSRALKAAGAGSSRIKAKAYWAPGKTGLD
ncbi:siderophore-interacting protein [Mesorhizobium sp. B2-3-4]|nr:siderophore-interacting protein [Mesorhizobium sp. B2-3-4]